MGVRKNDLVKFKDSKMYKVLDIKQDLPLIVIKGPYEGRSHKMRESTSLAIVVDLMVGNFIVERIKVDELERV